MRMPSRLMRCTLCGLMLLVSAGAAADTLNPDSNFAPASTAVSTYGLGLGLGLLGYLFLAWCLWKIARGLEVGDEWMAWMPLINIFTLFRCAHRPAWGVLLLLIPAVNLAVLAIIFMSLAERRGRLSLYGLLLFLPILNCLVMYSLTYLPKRRFGSA